MLRMLLMLVPARCRYGFGHRSPAHVDGDGPLAATATAAADVAATAMLCTHATHTVELAVAGPAENQVSPASSTAIGKIQRRQATGGHSVI